MPENHNKNYVSFNLNSRKKKNKNVTRNSFIILSEETNPSLSSSLLSSPMSSSSSSKNEKQVQHKKNIHKINNDSAISQGIAAQINTIGSDNNIAESNQNKR